MTNPHSEYDIAVGKILSAHALRGWVRVYPTTDVPDRHRTLKEVLVRTARTEQLLQIRAIKLSDKGTWLLHFEGINDRTAAEALRGAMMYIREADLPALPEGRYYVHQIIGLKVVTTEGRVLGSVTDVLETGANDVYVTPAGLLPATEEVIKQIDLEAGTMLVQPLPGMLDESADESEADRDEG